jgi:colanic acid biosynthesis protein WcaH
MSGPASQDRLTREQFRSIVQLTPLVSIDLLIVDPSGHFLLGLRNNQPAKGYWFVPGGIIFKGEKLEEAFTRILAVETGLAYSLSSASHVGVFEHFYEENRFEEPGYGTHYVVSAYSLALLARPNVRFDAQHRTMKWMPPGEILSVPNVHANTKAYFLKDGSRLQ